MSRPCRLVGLPVLALVAAMFAVIGPVSSASAADMDCADFATQKAAQTFFLNHGGPGSDPHRLDYDGDGIACESNPCPCYVQTIAPLVGSSTGPGKVVQRARVIFKEDSAAVDDVSEHGMQTRVFGTERGAVPYLNLSFALLEQAVLRSRAANPAVARVPLFNLGGTRSGGGQTLEATLAPLAGDTLVLAIGKVNFHLRVDGTGRVLGGRIPEQNVVADRR
jgi:hypothetical protein